MQGHLVKAATSGLANVVVSAATTVVALPILISLVGLNVYGVWAMLGMFVSFAMVLEMGLTRAIVHLVPGQETDSGELLTAAVCIVSSAAIALLAVFALLSSLGVNLLNLPADIPERLKVALVCAGCTVLICSLLTSVCRGFLEAAYSSHMVNLGFLLLTVLQYCSALAVAYFSGRAELLLLSTVSTHVVILLFHTRMVQRYSRLRFGRVRMVVIRTLLRRALDCFVASSPTVVLIPLMLYWLSAVAVNVEEYGRFDVAFRFATMAGTAIALIAVPLHVLVAGMKSPSWAIIARLMGQYTAVTIGALISGWALFLLIGRELLALLVGPTASDVWQACAYMLAGVGLLSAMEPIMRVSMGLGRFRQLFAVRGVVLATTVFVLTVLHTLPAIDRFSLSYALGCVAGAVAAVLLVPGLRSSAMRADMAREAMPQPANPVCLRAQSTQQVTS